MITATDIIRGKMAERKVRFDDIPGASSATYRRKIANPENLTLKEIERLTKSMKLSLEEEKDFLFLIYQNQKRR